MINLSIIDPNWGPQEIINVSLLMMDCGVAVVRRGGGGLFSLTLVSINYETQTTILLPVFIDDACGTVAHNYCK